MHFSWERARPETLSPTTSICRSMPCSRSWAATSHGSGAQVASPSETRTMDRVPSEPMSFAASCSAWAIGVSPYGV